MHHSKLGCPMSQLGLGGVKTRAAAARANPDSLLGGRTSAFASCGHDATMALGSYVPGTDSCTAAKSIRYSITSSVMESSDGGTVTPSIRAVSALMTNSSLVDCITGRSAGFAPLRIRPV